MSTFRYEPRVPGRYVQESTTSYDSRSDLETTGRDRTYSNRDPHNVSSYSNPNATHDESSYAPRDLTGVSRKDEESSRSKEADSSADTERIGSYNVSSFHHASYEKTECSCDEAGGWQKLSFLLLLVTFLGHAIAVCTPYWVVGYHGDQMTLYEGVWLSCHIPVGSISWFCSTYDTIRNRFEQPVWYEAAQVTAVLSLILLIPCLIVASLYSYVVSLRGRTRASFVFIAFMSSVALCSFLSFITFAAGYPSETINPPAETHLHVSFGLQIISFLFCLLSLGAHVRDSYPTLSVWDSALCSPGLKTPKIPAWKAPRMPGIRSQAPRLPPVTVADYEDPKPIPMVPVTTAPPSSRREEEPAKAAKPRAPSSSKFSFSMPKFPAALNRFRSKGGSASSGPDSPQPTAPPARDYDSPHRRDERETRGPATIDVGRSSGPSQAAVAASSYRDRSFASSRGGHNESMMSGYDSQV